MARHYFDAGTLFANPRIPAPIVSRITVGTVGTADVDPLANVEDADYSTVTDLQSVDASDYQYLQGDFGASVSVAKVLLRDLSQGVIDTHDAGVAVYLSATAITTGVFTSATQLTGPASWTPIPDQEDILFTAPGGSATGRYLYVVPLAPTTPPVLIGELEAWGAAIEFAVVQKVGVTTAFKATDLRGPAIVSRHPVDVAHTEGEVTVDCTHVEIQPGAIAQVLGLSSDNGAPWATYTPVGGSVRLPELFGVFTGSATDGKGLQLELARMIAPGAKVDFALGQFATEGVTFHAYLDAKESACRFIFQS